MEDLIPPQIRDSCKLALPDGLKELMSDITREVLRYQPKDLYKFIADYLSALLVTRENLSIAGFLCSDICQSSCEPELQAELRDLGLFEDDIKTARDIIVCYLKKDPKGPVDEGNLLINLIRDTNIDEDMLPAVQDAIRNAFLRHQINNTTKYESSSDSEQDGMMSAAKHTLDLYRKTAPSEETYGIMAEKIQKSYRAYGVRRKCKTKDCITKNTKTDEKSIALVDPQVTPQMSDFAIPKTTYSEEAMSMESCSQDPGIQISTSMMEKRLTQISSASLAGSFMTLPSFKPYSVHESNILSDLEEVPEREHAHIDYTVDNPQVSMVTEEKFLFKRDSIKKISFKDKGADSVKLKLN